MIYFIQEGDEDGPIKIGIANSPLRRLSILQIGNPRPLRLIGILRPTPRSLTEHELHAKFRSARIGGEWFKPTTELRRYIRDRAHTLDTERAQNRELAELLAPSEEDLRKQGWMTPETSRRSDDRGA